MDVAFPPIQMYPQKNSPTDKGRFSCISEPLDRLGIRFEQLWAACEELLKNPCPEHDRWLINSHTVESEVGTLGEVVFVIRVTMDGALLKAIGRNPDADGRDQLVYHQRVSFDKEGRGHDSKCPAITMWDMGDIWSIPELAQKQGPWSSEDLLDSVWAWRQDGRQATAYVTFHSDGRVGWNKIDDKQGKWELEDGTTLYVTVQSEDHVFEVAGDGKRMTILEPMGRKTLLTRMEGMYYKSKKSFRFLDKPLRIESWQEERTGVRSAGADVAAACQVGLARPAINAVMGSWGWEEFVKPGCAARAAMEALAFAGGRWRWLRDEGCLALLQAGLGGCDASSSRSGLARHLGLRRLAGVLSSELVAMWSKSSQWYFRIRADKALCMTATTSFWCDLVVGGPGTVPGQGARGLSPLGTYYQEVWPWMLHEGGVLPNARFLALDGRICRGSVKFSWRGGVLVTEMRADTPTGEQIRQRTEMQLASAELHMTLENEVTGQKLTRVFGRYPGYVIDNDTGEPVELMTYGPSDFVYLWPSMSRELSTGRNWVWASGEDVEEEQAVFRLANSRTVHEGVSLRARRDTAPDGRGPPYLRLTRDLFV
ncbi:unnamed protein product [Prorocentrum cordatum]|uniref:Uncharacterized protein n=1 Tax=Prorocentrum cordatum TaxID=2364126 RepID=A0ABN9QFD8_9DINO|nr:unnamed protein product [Polarella glacialis]